MLVITLTTVKISADDSPSRATIWLVAAAAWTACTTTWVASEVETLMSRIAEPISWAPAETNCRLLETLSAAAETVPAWTDASFAAASTAVETDVS